MLWNADICNFLSRTLQLNYPKTAPATNKNWYSCWKFQFIRKVPNNFLFCVKFLHFKKILVPRQHIWTQIFANTFSLAVLWMHEKWRMLLELQCYLKFKIPNSIEMYRCQYILTRKWKVFNIKQKLPGRFFLLFYFFFNLNIDTCSFQR